MRTFAIAAILVVAVVGCNKRRSSSSAPPSDDDPEVESTRPLDLEENIPQDMVVTATFTHDMDPATITTSTFRLQDGAGAPVAGTVSWNAATRTATFTPSALMADQVLYTATLSGAIRDLDGETLGDDYVWTFWTAGPPVGPMGGPPEGA
ncbi:MAG: Ig-like domain-containing protein [Planctomycetes bacterium]|nr:Ig-like domain-containing protein [Planctomycetota bacterium]